MNNNKDNWILSAFVFLVALVLGFLSVVGIFAGLTWLFPAVSVGTIGQLTIAGSILAVFFKDVLQW